MTGIWHPRVAAACESKREEKIKSSFNYLNPEVVVVEPIIFDGQIILTLCLLIQDEQPEHLF